MYRPSVHEKKLAVADTLSQAPEAALLLACARISTSEAGRLRIARELERVVDWPRFLQLAEDHGLLALAFRGLQGFELPHGVEMRLWTHFEQLQRKNRLMADELHALLQLFEAEDIPVVPYKGPTLASALYGSLEFREFGDLDLLVAPGDMLRARSLLSQRGYVPLFAVTPAIERAMLASRRHYHLALKKELMVELHWRTDAEFPIADLDDPAWWAARPRGSFEGREIRLLGEDELALALLLHGSKHLWEQLNWVSEASELLRSSTPGTWERLLDRAVELQARRPIAVGLALARRWFELPMPPQAVAWLDSCEEAVGCSDRIAQAWFETGTASHRSALTRLFMNLNIRDSFAQRVRHAFDVVVRPGLAEWTRWPLPRGLHGLYLPIRVFRLTAKHLRAIRRS
jgi:hypothetical protein